MIAFDLCAFFYFTSSAIRDSLPDLPIFGYDGDIPIWEMVAGGVCLGWWHCLGCICLLFLCTVDTFSSLLCCASVGSLVVDFRAAIIVPTSGSFMQPRLASSKDLIGWELDGGIETWHTHVNTKTAGWTGAQHSTAQWHSRPALLLSAVWWRLWKLGLCALG
ncbi:hypothetical protein VTL71DRAFT_2545 [Oculimacula yallundae]|uniref:Uncharacterized protein n=1 Tax=Oculimacula yallundae TaxID=86028 RepID=A0ABR4C967_9HELO